MIAQVVFDLPLDGPFDYLVPEHLVPSMAVGMRVKVSFGPRTKIGFVIGVLSQSVFSKKLKPVQSLCDASAAFNSLDLTFARDFCSYYGCSLGEALGTMLRNKTDHKPSLYRDHKPQITLHRCPPDFYATKIQEIIDEYKSRVSFLILVPDVFRGQTLANSLPRTIKIGTRSSVFECDGRHDCVIMVDDEDYSYKQEQMPMYDAAQVLLTRSKMYGFDIAFVGISPSVELMALAREGKIKLLEDPAAGLPSARLVDLSNYKFVPGFLSVPVRDALEGALKAGKKSILVLNSKGISVEQLQMELKKNFPRAKILSFSSVKRPKGSVLASPSQSVIARSPDGSAGATKQSLPDFDILISTQAVLRFQGILKAQFAAFINFDASLNRLDMRSAFNAFSLALHISSMALESVFIQTRNSHHYVLQSLSRGKIQDFYDEELKLRKEFGFAPFKHWVRISWRGKSEKSTYHSAQQMYNELSKSVEATRRVVSTENYIITPPLADAPSRQRDQFRFNVMVQADQVVEAVAFIKSTIAKIKRRSRVIITINIDP